MCSLFVVHQLREYILHPVKCSVLHISSPLFYFNSVVWVLHKVTLQVVYQHHLV